MIATIGELFFSDRSDHMGTSLNKYKTTCAISFSCINVRFVISSLALEISNQNGVIPARTSQKITATAYPSRRVSYKFKLSYELFSMFGMFA